MSTAPLRFAVSLQNDRPVAETVEHARLAEALGFPEIWTNENGHFRGIFTIASLIAATTTTTAIGLGIVNPFHRHPSVIAMEAAALDEASGGRVHLGIGAAQWNLRNLGEADERTERPYTSTVEAIRIIRALLRGEAVPKSEMFTISADARLDFEPFRRDLPVYAGAVNEKMLRAGAAWADSVELGALMSTGYVRWALEVIASGARDAGRDAEGLDIAAPLMVSVAIDASAAREAIKPRLAYYLHRVEKVVHEKSGADPDTIAAVKNAVLTDGLQAGAAAVTDEIIDTFAVAGDPDHAVTRFREYADAGIRGLIIQHVPGPERVEGLTLIAREVVPNVV
ncbi:MAG: LLM class flavin-dependent oxidoreductase [Acidimicrobiales bacterium]|jgi:5,10-methylenetetrahydromethanopterin reductase